MKTFKNIVAIITLIVTILFIAVYYTITYWVAEFVKLVGVPPMQAMIYVSTKNMMLICACFGAYFLINWSVNQLKLK